MANYALNIPVTHSYLEHWCLHMFSKIALTEMFSLLEISSTAFLYIKKITYRKNIYI